MTDCGQTERTHLLADGELSPAEAEAAREHLATCAYCQAELADIVQLDAAVGDVAPKRGQVVSIAWYRKRNVQLVAAVVAMAAAVVIFLATRKHPPVDKPEQVAIALAPKRMTEARVTWDVAAKYRAYDVPRGDVKHEQLGLAALAELEKRGDNHGIGVLALLEGDRKRAATYLDKLGETPDVLVDRAAIALGDGQPAVALALVDRAIEKQPAYGAALWNRALALRDLGLVRGAAEAFREVAKLGEPGWADEAAQRAKAIDSEADTNDQRYQRLNEASAELARGNVALSPDDARAQPGLARIVVYDAIRSATTPEALDKLAPLAKALDEADRDTAMSDAIGRAKTNLHPELSAAYGQIVRALAVEFGLTPKQGDDPPVPSGAARTQLLAKLRAAHADDLLLGVLLKTSDDRSRVNPSEIAEFAKLTAASPDPWMQLLGLSQQAQAAMRADDLMGAEAILLRAKERCTQPNAPPYRCIQLQKNLGELYLQWQRLPDARAALEPAWASARASGEWILQGDLLLPLAHLALLGDITTGSGGSLVRAYTDENVLRIPEAIKEVRCLNAAEGRTLLATLLVNRLDFDAARRALAGQACAQRDPEAVARELFVRAELATPADIAKLREDIAALRASKAANAVDQIELDHIEGRAIVGADAKAGEELLERAIAAAQKQPSTSTRAHKMAGYSYSVLAVAAAKRGDGEKALATLAAEQGLTAPKTCVVGIAIEDRQRAFVARDVAGTLHVHHDEARTQPAIDSSTLVPADITAAVEKCAAVDVIARAPVHGMPRLFDDKIAWRYLSQRTHPVAASGAKSLIVANVEPPAGLELPRLAAWQATGTAETISGAAATPSRVLAAISSAGDVVINVHGIVDSAQPDASFLALSPEPDGRYALSVADVRKATLAASPLVILAACRASQAAPVWHEVWSLPAAFVYAGARAVIASAAPIPDAEASAFFDDVRARTRAGAPVAVALRDARVAWLETRATPWVRDVIVFE